MLSPREVKTMLPHSHFARIKRFSYKVIASKLKLERLVLYGRLLRGASPSSMCEVVPIWNLIAANA